MTDKALEDSDLKLLDPGEYYIIYATTRPVRHEFGH